MHHTIPTYQPPYTKSVLEKAGYHLEKLLYESYAEDEAKLFLDMLEYGVAFILEPGGGWWEGDPGNCLDTRDLLIAYQIPPVLCIGKARNRRAANFHAPADWPILRALASNIYRQARARALEDALDLMGGLRERDEEKMARLKASQIFYDTFDEGLWTDL